MTLHRLVPSEVEAESLADLLDDARAIPTAAFSRSNSAVRPTIDVTAAVTPQVAIPATTVSLVKSARSYVTYGSL